MVIRHIFLNLLIFIRYFYLILQFPGLFLAVYEPLLLLGNKSQLIIDIRKGNIFNCLAIL
jgi:hypothetical protein